VHSHKPSKICGGMLRSFSSFGIFHLLLLFERHLVDEFVLLHPQNFFSFLSQQVEDEHRLHVAAHLRDRLHGLGGGGGGRFVTFGVGHFFQKFNLFLSFNFHSKNNGCRYSNDFSFRLKVEKTLRTKKEKKEKKERG
jgi:hypothetical protein